MTLSSEIDRPLTIVGCYAEILQHLIYGPLDNDQIRMVQRITQKVNDMRRILDSAQGFSNSEIRDPLNVVLGYAERLKDSFVVQSRFKHLTIPNVSPLHGSIADALRSNADPFWKQIGVVERMLINIDRVNAALNQGLGLIESALPSKAITDESGLTTGEGLGW